MLDGFRSSWWKAKLENKSTTQVLDNKEDPLHELFRLIRFHMFKIYTLAQLHHFYEEISAEGETKSTLRSTDLKNKLVEKFDNKLEFMKSSQSSTSNTSEFVMSLDESVLPN